MGIGNFMRIDSLMKNIQLNYRYRDAHNYKEFGSVVFSNPSGVTVEEASAKKVYWTFS